MRCSSCGTELPAQATYCPACGAVTPYQVSDSGVSPFTFSSRQQTGLLVISTRFRVHDDEKDQSSRSHHCTRLHRSCPDTGTWQPSSYTVSVGWLARGRIAHAVVEVAAAVDGHCVQGRQVRC